MAAKKWSTIKHKKDAPATQNTMKFDPKLVSIEVLKDELFALDENGQIWLYVTDDFSVHPTKYDVNEFRKVPMKFNHDWVPPETPNGKGN